MPDTESMAEQTSPIEQGSVIPGRPEASPEARATSFRNWLESMREAVAARNPAAAAQLEGIHDEDSLRELLRSPRGHGVVTLLIGAMPHSVNGAASSQ